MTATSGSMALAPSPIAESHPGPQLVPTPIHTEPIIATPITAEPILSVISTEVERPAAPTDIDLTALQAAMVAALAAVKGQTSASEQLEDCTLTINASTLEIQTTLSARMLPVGINADAEKLLLATLRAHTPLTKLKLLPGAPADAATPKKPRTALAGSAAELAANHPVVQQAKQLFSAEISNIIDLREK
jgi:DNA polymerase-3 subunit gamma/tau